MTINDIQKKRCFGNAIGEELYAEYHDNEWGVPVYNDSLLYEMLILEGAQAGLSWEIILKKREGYRRAFHQFDVEKIAGMSDKELEYLRKNKDIVRNRLKIYSARKNALVFISIQKEFGSFAEYIWSYVNNKPIINHWQSLKDVPVTTSISDKISRDLKKRGMSFVGSVIIYAYMQAIGMVDDHIKDCWCYLRNR